MSQADYPTSHLTRRAWIVLAGSALGACGGGGSMTGSPGTGGTGAPVYALGSISGFGSVILNGIKFDDLNATVWLDDVKATSIDLRLGMVAGVQGVRGADLTMGTAHSVEVWKIAQGVVTPSSASSSTSAFVVAGMTIQTSVNTVFEGVGVAGQPVVGQPVAVWGLQAGADASQWNATRVEVLSEILSLVSSGLVRVSAMSTQRSLNGIALTGALAGTLPAGALVRVQGVLAADGSLEVTSAKVVNAGLAAQTQGDAEIEGYVTALGLSGHLTLGNIDVDAGNAKVTPAGAAVVLGASVEIHGTWASGVLKATLVQIEDPNTSQLVQIDGLISAFTSVADFVVRGQRCDATNATFRNGAASGLKVNAKVKVSGTQAGDFLKVATLEFES